MIMARVIMIIAICMTSRGHTVCSISQLEKSSCHWNQP